MQLKVVKSDSTIEQYMHTKVMGSISNALTLTNHYDASLAESLAEVVTYFLHKENHRTTTTSEIFSIIKAVLASTDHQHAAITLGDHRNQRKLKRSRIEVVSIDISELSDAQILCEPDEYLKARWDKSVIINDLITKYQLNRQVARTIASLVEEKIFRMEVTKVPLSLIKQLVLSDTAIILNAQRKLQTT